MAVFISHDFDDKPQFDNIAWALETADIPYFNPYEMLAGRSLAEMLREAIRESEVCVFIATHKSVDSGWCGAEIGAFWGIGKKVVIFVADASLDGEKLPKQFKGHLWESRLPKVVAAVEKHLENASAGGAQHPAKTADLILASSPSDRVSEMTRSELRLLIESAIQRSQTEAISSSVVDELAELIGDLAPTSLDETGQRRLRASLNKLLGLPETILRQAALDSWPHQFVLAMTTGEWVGYALEEKQAGPGGDISIYLQCLLLRFDEQQRVTAAAVLPRVNDEQGIDRGWQLTEPVAIVGRGQIGKLPDAIHKEEGLRYVPPEHGAKDEINEQLEKAANEDRETAIERLSRVRDEHPEDFRAYGKLTEYFLEAEEPARARDLLLANKDRFSRKAAYFHSLGLTFNKLDQLENALRAKKRAVELRPADHTARTALAYGLWKMGQLPAAIEESEEALRMAEKQGSPQQIAKNQNSLAYYLAERGDPQDKKRAVELVEKALEVGQHAPWLDTKGFVLLQFGETVDDLDLAIKTLIEAMTAGLSPAVGTEHLRLASERKSQLDA